MKKAIAFVCLLAVYAAVERLVVTATWRGSGLSAHDRAKFRMIADAKGIAAGSRQDEAMLAYGTRVWAKFAAHRMTTFAHLIAGIFLLLAAPLQFSSRFRTENLRRHRVLGRMLLIAGLAPALSSIYFGTVDGAVMPSASFFFGAFFIFAAVRGFMAIRQRDIRRHREWMIRMYAVAVGAGTIRAVTTLIYFTMPVDISTALRTSFWIGELLTLVAAEIYIRAGQRAPIPVTP